MRVFAVWSNFDERARRLGILDTKLAQAAAIFVALSVAKLVPEIMNLGMGWFLSLACLCAIRPVFTFFGRKT